MLQISRLSSTVLVLCVQPEPSVLLYLMSEQIETNLPPLPLLRLLKNIESAVGRVSSIRNGPRAIDLDIVLYGDAVIDTRPLSQRANLNNLMGELVVPHPRMVEREFVLRPMNEWVHLIVYAKGSCS